MPEPRIRRTRTRSTRPGQPPGGSEAAEAAEAAAESQATPAPDDTAAPEAGGAPAAAAPEAGRAPAVAGPEATPAPEPAAAGPEATPAPERTAPAPVDRDPTVLAPAEAESAEAAAEALAVDDVAGDGETGPVAAGTGAAGAASGEPAGWFRDAPLDDGTQPAAEAIAAGAAGSADGTPAGATGADEAADDDLIVRERDRAVVAPAPVVAPPAGLPTSRRRRLRGILVGIVTVVAVAAVGFVAGLMLPTILPGPGIGSTGPSPSTMPTVAPATPAAPTATPTAAASPTPTIAPAPTPSPAPTQTIYVVKAGDQLARIAARYGVSLAAIQKANNIKDPNRIFVGQKLIIPVPQPKATPGPTP